MDDDRRNSSEQRRGAEKRRRRTVKWKFEIVVAIEKAQQELSESADDNDCAPPTLLEVFKRLEREGLKESFNNLYKWYRDRDEISRYYEKEKKLSKQRKRKTVGSGRKAAAPKAEAAVKAMIVDRRAKTLRVPRAIVKKRLKEYAISLDGARTLKFSKSFYCGAFQRMGVVSRRISSGRNVTNEGASLFGRFFCNEMIQLRRTGGNEFLSAAWAQQLIPDSTFGFFRPENIYAIDEVPANFARDGHTVVEKGKDAAVRTLRGTGKRFCTLIIGAKAIGAKADGDLLPVVVIFKKKKDFLAKEKEVYDKLKHVIVTYSESSYVNEQIWKNKVVDKMVLQDFMRKYGREFYKRRALLLSDNHSSHLTPNVLKYCGQNAIMPAFTPPNYTSHWSMIDDQTGTSLRDKVYDKAEAHELKYFDENPNGDGGISAGDRRKLFAQWVEEVWEESLADPAARLLRVNSAKRNGLYVTPNVPADSTYLPQPVRFLGTAYEHFGETLYDVSHPDFSKTTPYKFCVKVDDELPAEEFAKDEDGFSHEEQDVWLEDEMSYKSDSEEAPSDEDVGFIAEEVFKKRALKRREGSAKIVQQFRSLDEAEKIRRLRKKNK